MKNILKLCCIISALFCLVFPIWYFHGLNDIKEIKISHILLDSQEEAASVLNEINGGLKFSAATRKYSKDTSTKEKSGDIGYHGKYNLLEPAIANTVFKLKKNQVSNPVETRHGWHLLRVTDVVYFSDRKNFDERYYYTAN